LYKNNVVRQAPDYGLKDHIPIRGFQQSIKATCSGIMLHYFCFQRFF